MSDAPVDIRGCEVCSRERQVHVRCSGVGPMSMAYCEECLVKGAEPEWAFQYLWDYVADRKRGSLAAHVEGGTCWKDGRYWSWDEWVTAEIANPRPEPEYPEMDINDEVSDEHFSVSDDDIFGDPRPQAETAEAVLLDQIASEGEPK